MDGCGRVGVIVVVLSALALHSIQDTYTATSLVNYQREFGLLREQADTIAVAKWIGFIPGLLIFAYMGGRGDRLRWLLIGMLLALVGNVLIMLPHFIYTSTPPRFNLTAYNEIFFVDEEYTNANATPEKLFSLPLVKSNLEGTPLATEMVRDLIEDMFREENGLPEKEDESIFDWIGKRRKRSALHPVHALGGRGGLPAAMLEPVEQRHEDGTKKLKEAFEEALFGEGNITYPINMMKNGLKLLQSDPLRSGIMRAVSSPFGFCSKPINQLRTMAARGRCRAPYANFGALGIIIGGTLIAAFGIAAIWPLGLVILDDHVSRLSFAALLTLGLFIDEIFGNFVGGIASALLNRVWYTTEAAPFGWNVLDPRWIGAYWLGNAGLAVLYAVLAACLLILRQCKDVHGHTISKSEYQNESPPHCTGPCSYTSRTLSSALFVLLALSLTLLGLANVGIQSVPADILNGIGTENNKRGAIVYAVLGAVWAIGLITGYVIVVCARFSSRGILRMAFACILLAAILSFVRMAITCDSLQHEVYRNGASNSSIECNAACDCGAVKTAIPVCDEDGNAYFSPCHAGCRKMERIGRITLNFTQCECAPNRIVSPNWCTDDCRSAVYIRYALDALIVLLESLHFMPVALLLIRSVREKLRSMALGISGAVISIGVAYAPLIYHTLANTTCTKWEYLCDDTDDERFLRCKFYDRTELRISIYAFDGGIRLLAVILYAVALTCMRRTIVVLSNSNNGSSRLTDSDEIDESAVWLNRTHVDSERDRVDLLTKHN